jgi:hypothetical protein
MTAPVFVDSNVIVYARDASDVVKQETCTPELVVVSDRRTTAAPLSHMPPVNRFTGGVSPMRSNDVAGMTRPPSAMATCRARTE